MTLDQKGRPSSKDRRSDLFLYGPRNQSKNSLEALKKIGDDRKVSYNRCVLTIIHLCTLYPLHKSINPKRSTIWVTNLWFSQYDHFMTRFRQSKMNGALRGPLNSHWKAEFFRQIHVCFGTPNLDQIDWLLGHDGSFCFTVYRVSTPQTNESWGVMIPGVPEAVLWMSAT